MATIQDLFWDRSKRPEPDVVSEISKEEIIETVVENPQILDACSSKEARERVDSILRSKTYTVELPNLLPYIEELVIEIMKQYRGRSMLFAARDADILYDALRTTLGNSVDTVFRLPGSQALMLAMCGMSEIPRFADLVRGFLSDYGITEREILTGRKYLVFDTGFRGTIGGRLKDTASNIFGAGSFNPKEDISVSLVSHDQTDIYGAKELKTFVIPQKQAKRKFPKTFNRFGDNHKHHTDNFYLAVALQLLPKFHGAYTGLTSEGRPRVRTSSIEYDIDYAPDVNASIVNPVAALLVQAEVVKYFQQRRDEVLRRI